MFGADPSAQLSSAVVKLSTCGTGKSRGEWGWYTSWSIGSQAWYSGELLVLL